MLHYYCYIIEPADYFDSYKLGHTNHLQINHDYSLPPIPNRVIAGCRDFLPLSPLQVSTCF